MGVYGVTAGMSLGVLDDTADRVVQLELLLGQGQRDGRVELMAKRAS